MPCSGVPTTDSSDIVIEVERVTDCQVLIEELEAGVWLKGTATVLPDNEPSRHEAHASSDLACEIA